MATTTQREARIRVCQKLGGHLIDTISLQLDVSNTAAQRTLVSAKLYDAERGTRSYSGAYAWIGRDGAQRRVKEGGYSQLSYAVYIVPTVAYIIKLFGYGNTASIATTATDSFILDAVQGALGGDSALIDSVTLENGVGASEVGERVVLEFTEVVDIAIVDAATGLTDVGTIDAQGGVGAIETVRGFNKLLTYGTEFELSPKLPVEDADSLQGVHTLTNNAAKKMWIIDRFPVTPENTIMGTQQIFGLSNETWLSNRKQIIAVYGPADHQLVSTLTSPTVTGTYTLTFDMGTNTYTTEAIAYDAVAATIETAVNAAFPIDFTVTGTTTKIISSEVTRYAQPALTITITSGTGGTVTNVVTQLTDPIRQPTSWLFQYEGEKPYVSDVWVGNEGESIFVEAYRPANTWVCRQASYGTSGTVWESTTTGLVDDYDMLAVDVESLTALTHYLACEQLASLGPANEVKTWKKAMHEAAYVAAAVKTYDLPYNDKPGGGGLGGGTWGRKGAFGIGQRW